MANHPVTWSDDGGPPWERQATDTDKSFAAFQAYRNLGADRSLAKAAEERGVSEMQCRDWSARDGWRWRAAAYDAYIDAEQIRARVKEVRDMERRHAQVASAGLAGLTLPFVALGQPRILHQNREMPRLEELRRMPTAELVRLAARSANSLSRLVGVERISRGEPTEIVSGQVDVGPGYTPPTRESVLGILGAMLDADLIRIEDGGLVAGGSFDDAEVVEEQPE